MEIENNSSEQEILIVEDSPTQAEVLKFLLEKHNYRVSVACNGREAFNLLNKHKPIMVISDIVMPEMDGYQLCRSIKGNENLKDIPVILLTALSDPTDVLKGLECGADNFVIKPYDEKYLLSRIQYVLANRMLYESDKTQMGIEIFFGDQKYYITSARQQILNLLLFTYETAVQKNLELHRAQDELSALNEQLEKNVDERTASLRAEIEVRSLGEIALRESEERYRRLVEESPYGIAIHNEGKIVYMNMAGAKILGTEYPHEFVGKMLLQIVHPDYHEIAKNRIRMQEEGKVAPPLEEKFLRLDGNSVDVEITSIPFTYMGKLAMYGVFRDITERKRSQDILAQSEEKYRTLIDNASDAILIADEKGNLLEANKKAEQLLGYKKQELSNMNITQIHPDKERERSFGAFKEIIKNISGCLIDTQVLRKDGKTVPVDITGSLIDFEGKRVLLEIFRDITERKRAEQINVENLRLAAADQAKSEFLANMSHELRTPLNSSIGFSELLKQGSDGELSEKQKHFVDNILASNQFLLTLINDILDLSKIEAGKIELVPDKMSVPVTIKETLSLIKEKAMDHNVILKTEFDPQIEFIQADRQRFKQILFNLLSNAVKFSKETGGTLTITAKKAGDMVKISVSDTGIGIKEENVSKLFQKFEQLESGISKKYGGTGLGLAITKQLVELHGGKIWAESQFGEGTTFIFLLPILAKISENK